ncbi:MAG: hypothetical protein LBC75_05900 [Fibromonadaceae bacterium]|jgi:uncharacterized protein (TIGR02145 family)|nr:hypothetical protein [Fibromonadaceae bacterium]
MVLRFFMFAAVIFLSCTVLNEVIGEPRRDNPYDEKSNTYIAPNIVYGDSVDYEGEIYKTVVIGTQTWFQRNLNYDVDGSRCYEDKVVNCNKYGRLYSWATAMALPDECNTSNCNSLLSEKNKGICPDGWHIPSNEEWKTLQNFAGGYTAFHLKAKDNWYEPGLDTYGFSAMPGGYGSPESYFYYDGGNYSGYWWSDDVNKRVCITGPYSYDDCRRYISSNYSNGHYLHSVRCVKDKYGSTTPSSSSKPSSSSTPSSSSSVQSSSSVRASSSSSTPSSSSAAQSSSSVRESSSSSIPSSSSISIKYGPSVDHGGEIYKTVVIGTQTWFQRNLNYDVEGSRCYSEKEYHCDTYGKLYNWAAAMALDTSCNSNSCSMQINEKHQGICPKGWHIPSNQEWATLIDFVGKNYREHLKAESGWNSDNGENNNGKDTYGFSALPGGYYLSGTFSDVGKSSFWWTATENNATYAHRRDLASGSILDGMEYEYTGHKKWMYSIRCLKD